MLQVENLTVGYGDNLVLQDINLQLRPSSIMALVGHNGAGKTTLLQAMMGITCPKAGRVLYKGRDVFNDDISRQEMFFVPDDPYIMPFGSMERLGKYYAAYYPRFNLNLLEKLAGLINIDPRMHISRMSKGMKRQTAIMVGIAAQTKVLLLDELFDGLDPVMRRLICSLTLELISQQGTSVVVSSHNLRELYELCDRVAIIKNKSIVYETDMDRIAEQWHMFHVFFEKEVTREALAALQCRDLRLSGGEAAFVTHRPEEEVRALLTQLGAVQISAQPLTLEELFLQQMEVQSHDFKDWFK